MASDPDTDPGAFSRLAQGLWKAASTPTDELAAKRGEGDMLVKIKRNSDRLEGCTRHDFERQPNWRSGPLYNQRVRCLRCEGEMKAADAMLYLRGYAHGTGQDYRQVIALIWPEENGNGQ